MSKILWNSECGDAFEVLADNIMAPIYPWLYKDCCNIIGESLTGKILLEIGGGPGHMAKEFLSHAVSPLVELDISPGMLDKSKKRNSQHIHFIQGSASHIPIQSNYFDIVFSRGSIMFWDNLPSAFSEIKRVLKTNGFAILGGGYGLSTPSKIIDKIRSKHSHKSSIPRLNFSDITNHLEVEGGVSSIISKPKVGFWIKWLPHVKGEVSNND